MMHATGERASIELGAPEKGDETDQLLPVLEDKLAQGKSAMRTIRLRVTGTMVAVAIVFLFLIQLSERLGQAATTWSEYALWNALDGVFVVIFLTAANLSPLPTDKRLVQFLYIFHGVLGGVILAMARLEASRDHLRGRSSAEACSAKIHNRPVSSGKFCLSLAVCDILVATFLLVVAFAGHVFCLCRPKSPLEQIERLFKIQKVFFSLVITTELFIAVVCFLWVDTPLAGLAHLFCMLADVLMVLVAYHKQWRETITSRLGRMFDAHAATASAAGIACLLGEASVADVLSQAKSRFRGIRLSSLAEPDLADSKPNPELFQRALATHLGSVQFFVSHSWRDNASTKWAALRKLCEDRAIADDGGEPLLWIDKCCIDQRDIANNLRCLPVFLSGCERLVIMLGKTYLTRLWCIVEIFVFVHMGGKPSNIVILPVAEDGEQDRDELAALSDTTLLQGFDARTCDCFVQEEREKILTIIATAFGGFDAFNAEVRSLLQRARAQDDHV